MSFHSSVYGCKQVLSFPCGCESLTLDTIPLKLICKSEGPGIVNKVLVSLFGFPFVSSELVFLR